MKHLGAIFIILCFIASGIHVLFGVLNESAYHIAWATLLYLVAKTCVEEKG